MDCRYWPGPPNWLHMVLNASITRSLTFSLGPLSTIQRPQNVDDLPGDPGAATVGSAAGVPGIGLLGLPRAMTSVGASDAVVGARPPASES
eukprot:1365945-Pyramimonas_sp.AAC.1